MATSESRARWAYELGRLRLGVRQAWPLLALVPLALALHEGSGLGQTVAVGGLTLLVATAFGWRGQGLGRGARFGFLVGAPLPFIPSIAMWGHTDCCAPGMHGVLSACSSFSACLVACSIAGLTAGVLVGWRAARDPHGSGFAIGAGAVAGLLGVLGCTMVGVLGMIGVVGGLVLAAPPVLLWVRRTA
jgi:hypothetical protein